LPAVTPRLSRGGMHCHPLCLPAIGRYCLSHHSSFPPRCAQRLDRAHWRGRAHAYATDAYGGRHAVRTGGELRAPSSSPPPPHSPHHPPITPSTPPSTPLSGLRWREERGYGTRAGTLRRDSDKTRTTRSPLHRTRIPLTATWLRRTWRNDSARYLRTSSSYHTTLLSTHRTAATKLLYKHIYRARRELAPSGAQQRGTPLKHNGRSALALSMAHIGTGDKAACAWRKKEKYIDARQRI